MKAHQLIMRDPALAAISGAIGDGNADFGGEFGSEFGDEFGDDDFDTDTFAGDYDFGKEAVKQNSIAKRMAQTVSLRRRAMLNPNKYSALKIEGYTFPLSETIVLGTASALDMSSSPDVKIRPQRLACNAPAPMFAYFTQIKMANVDVMVGGASEDAYMYNANGVGQSLDCPTLTPSNRARITGTYSGFTPPGYTPGSTQTFTASFKGPSQMVG